MGKLHLVWHGSRSKNCSAANSIFSEGDYPACNGHRDPFEVYSYCNKPVFSKIRKWSQNRAQQGKSTLWAAPPPRHPAGLVRVVPPLSPPGTFRCYDYQINLPQELK